jgi:hypothetical protein
MELREFNPNDIGDIDIMDSIYSIISSVFNTIEGIFTSFQSSAGYIIFFAQLLVAIGIIVIVLISLSMLEKYLFRPVIWVCENVFRCTCPKYPCISIGCPRNESLMKAFNMETEEDDRNNAKHNEYANQMRRECQEQNEDVTLSIRGSNEYSDTETMSTIL